MASIGTVVKTTVDIMGNPKGSFGICYENYGSGSSFLFENGSYDGFSQEDQELMLEIVGISEKHSNYKFTNVIKVSNDLKDGYFDFNQIKSQFNG